MVTRASFRFSLIIIFYGSRIQARHARTFLRIFRYSLIRETGDPRWSSDVQLHVRENVIFDEFGFAYAHRGC